MVENRLIAEFFSSQFNPWGPIITPDIISPIIPGTLIGRRIMGESKIIKSTSEKISTGFCRGASKAWEICSKVLFISARMLSVKCVHLFFTIRRKTANSSKNTIFPAKRCLKKAYLKEIAFIGLILVISIEGINRETMPIKTTARLTSTTSDQ